MPEDDGLQNVEIAVPAVELFHKMLAWSERTFHRKRDELRKAGVIFLLPVVIQNKKGKRQIVTKWHSFPSKIIQWCGAKGQDGEMI